MSETNCYILNTCHIREKQLIFTMKLVVKKFRNKNKPIVLIVGCVAQAEGDILLKRSYIDAVIGPQSYHKINGMIEKLENKINQLTLQNLR